MPVTQRIPVVDYLVLADPPHLVACECRGCGALYFDRRNACARCPAVEFTRRPLATTGEVRAFTVVHRASKSVPVPYTSVVVDLDGGGVVKATLRGVTDPDAVRPRLPVRLVTFPVGEDDDGVEAVAFGFEMQEEPA